MIIEKEDGTKRWVSPSQKEKKQTQMKYPTSLRISMPTISWSAVQKLTDMTGIKCQDIIRTAIYDYCTRETKRLQREHDKYWGVKKGKR